MPLNHGNCLPEESGALPAALWQLFKDVERSARMSKDTERSPRMSKDIEKPSRKPLNLAMIIPDGRFLGTAKVRPETGRTRLEALHGALVEARPSSLRRCRIELVWRSVAALKAVLGQEGLGETPGAVLVISVNRRTFWTVMELRHWSPRGDPGGPICIVRRPVMDCCDEYGSWTHQRMENARTALSEQGMSEFGPIHRWTRLLEIMATDMPSGSWANFGICPDGLENRSWPKPDGSWRTLESVPSVRWTGESLPDALIERIRGFLDGKEGSPLGVVIENPAGPELTAKLESLVKQVAGSVRIWRATGHDTAIAARQLARALGKDSAAPAWLDEVPGIELEVRRTGDGEVTENTNSWLPVIPGHEAIPAGQTYHSRLSRERRVTLAPGIEHVHLHLRRGQEGAWDERYSGRSTGHTIRP